MKTSKKSSLMRFGITAIFVIPTTAFAFVALGQPHEPKASFALEEAPPLTSKKEMQGVTASVSLESVQKATNGIKLNLVVQNTTDSAKDIQNVLNFTRFVIANSQGTIIRLPSVSGGIFANRPGKNDNSPTLPFKILSAKIGSSVISPDTLKSSSILLPPNSNLEFEISIDKIRNPDASLPQKEIQIPAGKYKFRVTTLLSTTAQIKSSKQIESPLIQVELTE